MWPQGSERATPSVTGLLVLCNSGWMFEFDTTAKQMNTHKQRLYACQSVNNRHSSAINEALCWGAMTFPQLSLNFTCEASTMYSISYVDFIQALVDTCQIALSRL